MEASKVNILQKQEKLKNGGTVQATQGAFYILLAHFNDNSIL